LRTRTPAMRLETLSRAAFRRSGAKQLASTVASAGREEAYEERVRSAFLAAVRPGDVVWDVGANVGLYTSLFGELVGPAGKVVAFEPVPQSYRALLEGTTEVANVVALNRGLSDRPGRMPMVIAGEPTAATNSFFGDGPGERIELELAAGDDLAEGEQLPLPDVVKIDVEGFELEVLTGLRGTIGEPRCRMVLCEVHFGILDARGQRHAPNRIQRFLSSLGFGIEWIDASHVAGYRA
jgi:FkbM family methyltransferase